MGRVREPTKNPGPAAWIPSAPHGAELLLAAAGLLSRGGLGLARPSWRETCVHVSLNQGRPARVPPRGPAAFAVPSRHQQRAEEAGVPSEGPCAASRKGWQLLEQLREGCSREREVTSPGSARQLQATAVSEKRGVCTAVLLSLCRLFVDMSQQRLLTGTMDIWTHLGLVPETAIQLTKHSVYRSCHKDLLIPTDRKRSL